MSTAAKLTSQNKASEELDGTSEELDATSKEDHNSSNSSVLDALTGHCDEEDDSDTISEDNKWILIVSDTNTFLPFSRKLLILL